ncbi:MAG: hypothetical protein U9R44_00440, partial [Candidatus Omnitrophota bacterium]|nr:hypothetical protein [Candidatus Omnitrophota bacterium]
VMDVPSVGSFHNLVAVEGEAGITINGEKYRIPDASPGGEMLIVPAAAGSYSISADKKARIIDTFIPA